MSPAPAPAHQILLAMLGTRHPPAAEAFRSMQGDDWDAIARMAKQHRLGPLLLHRFEAAGRRWPVPSPLLDQWRAATRTAAVVKADSYGLGAGRVAPALYQAGTRDFFVALAEEGAKLLRSLAPNSEQAGKQAAGEAKDKLNRALDSGKLRVAEKQEDGMVQPPR